MNCKEYLVILAESALIECIEEIQKFALAADEESLRSKELENLLDSYYEARAAYEFSQKINSRE